MRRTHNMLIGTAALMLLGLVAIVYAQPRPTADDAELAKLAFGSARGLVVDVDGRPVEDATIEFSRLWDMSDGAHFSQRLKSDSTGRFVLDQLRGPVVANVDAMAGQDIDAMRCGRLPLERIDACRNHADGVRQTGSS